MNRPMIRALGVTAGTICIAIGIAAQLGGADLFGTPSYSAPVSLRPPTSATPSPAATPSPQQSSSPPSLVAAGTIYPPYAGSGGGRYTTRKKKGRG